jgi:hypothetical protein
MVGKELTSVDKEQRNLSHPGMFKYLRWLWRETLQYELYREDLLSVSKV